MTHQANIERRARAIVDTIISAERINDSWERIVAPPPYPRQELITQLVECGHVGLNVLLKVLRTGDGLAQREASHLIDWMEQSNPAQVIQALQIAAGKPGKGQFSAAMALAKRDSSLAVAAGLHLDPNTRRGVLAAMRDRPQRMKALQVLYTSHDHRALIDALDATNPELLDVPSIRALVISLLKHESLGIAHRAGHLLCSGFGNAPEVFINLACKRIELVNRPIAKQIAERGHAAKLIEPLASRLPGSMGPTEEPIVRALLTLLRGQKAGRHRLRPEDRELLVTRLSPALAEEPKRPQAWQILKQLIDISGFVGDARLVKPLVAILSWEGGHGRALREEITTALANYPLVAEAALTRVTKAAKTPADVRALAVEVLAKIENQTGGDEAQHPGIYIVPTS